VQVHTFATRLNVSSAAADEWSLAHRTPGVKLLVSNQANKPLAAAATCAVSQGLQETGKSRGTCAAHVIVDLKGRTRDARARSLDARASGTSRQGICVTSHSHFIKHNVLTPAQNRRFQRSTFVHASGHLFGLFELGRCGPRRSMSKRDVGKRRLEGKGGQKIGRKSHTGTAGSVLNLSKQKRKQ